MICFSVLGLAIVALQRLMFAVLPPIPNDPDGIRFMAAMDAIHSIWFFYLPCMLAGGIVFTLAGIGVIRGSLTARRIAQANALFGYAWLIAYAFACNRAIPMIPFPVDILPRPVIQILQWLILTIGTLIGALIPTALLFVLRHPGDGKADFFPDYNSRSPKALQ